MATPLAALFVLGPDGPRPFMRGILVQSLVSRGVPFDLALETATKIRDRMLKLDEVTPEDISKLADEYLGEEFDLERRIDPVSDFPHVVDSRGTRTPFSKGMMAISLQGAGLEPSDAYDVARELESRLLRSGTTEVDRLALRGMVAETIERSFGAKTAERYRVWRRAVEDGRPIFLLVGGSTGAGKTSIAVEVARRLEISRVVGTDSIRQIMRLMFSRDLMPEIHHSTYDAHRAIKPDALGPGDPVLAGFREQAQKIVVGVHALLDRAVEENTSMLIEGVNLLPSLLDLDRYRDVAHVIFLVVATLDLEDYRNRFIAREARARKRSAERYLDHFDAIAAIQNYILAESDHQDIPIIDNVSFDDAVLSVTRSVIATLRKSMAQELPL